MNLTDKLTAKLIEFLVIFNIFWACPQPKVAVPETQTFSVMNMNARMDEHHFSGMLQGNPDVLHQKKGLVSLYTVCTFTSGTSSILFHMAVTHK